MTRIIAKLFVLTFFLMAFLHVAPVSAASVVWISSGGSDVNPCNAAQPCTTFYKALTQLFAGGQVNCLNSPGPGDYAASTSLSFTVDCAGGVYQMEGPDSGAFYFYGTNQVVKIRNLTISGALFGYPGINVVGSGTLILENCVLENIRGSALDIEPNGPFNLVIKNSRISNNTTTGILLKPASGGSINATLDHVTITGNTGTGGGIKTDSASGIVNLDVTESEISNNDGVGVNARSGGSLNMVSIKNSVITKNTAQGVQANGANVGVIVQTTLFDQNTSGATSVVAGGHISTYGNNSIVGSSGSGFTGTASLQ
jgi:hypothetical protein